MLLGREAETRRISALLDGARRGRSGVLIVKGEPGIGKSAMLSYAGEHAADATVLRTAGVDGEAELPYVNLADLLRPAAQVIPAIPPRQQAALAAVLALGPPDAGDRLAVAAATLNLLAALADRCPVLVVVDDVQWLDSFTTEVLLFVANRLGADAITVLMAARSGHRLPAGFGRFETMTLDGLDEPSAHRLVRDAGGTLDTASASRLVAEANGNPLALKELPGLLTPSQLALWTRGTDPLPIDSVMADAYSGTVRLLPSATQEALLMLAILGSLPIAIVEQALLASGLSPHVLDPAEHAGLIVWRGDQFGFRHPLVRAAVHENAAASHRRRAHLCAAQVLVDSELPTALERRAWHLVAAGITGDEGTASVIAHAAQDEARRANFAVAGTLFERSAQLSPAGDVVATRLLRAADCNRLAGAVEQAADLLRRALPLSADTRMQRRIRYFLCRIDLWRGSVIAGRDDLLRLAGEADDDPGLATLCLSVAALASVEAGELAAARQACDLASVAYSHGTTPLPVAAVRALVLGLVGDVEAADTLLTERGTELDASDPLEADLAEQMLLVAGMAHLQLEQTARAERLLDRAVTGARDASALGVLPFRLGRLALAQFWRGRLSAALASAHEALQLAGDTGWTNERPNSLAALARCEAVLDRADDCRDHARQAENEALTSGAISYAGYAGAALGLLELGEGNDEAAVGHLTHVDEFAVTAGVRDSPLLWWSADLVESLVRQGDLGRAARVLARLDDSVQVMGLPTAAAVAARCRSLLEPDDFAAHLAEALRWHAQAPMPFELARTELQLGSQLRRRRLRGDARPYLESALTAFERLGAQAWAARTRVELEAAGVHLGAPREGWSQLTPQELQVVLKVASGMANREVATQLFLSVKTVEFHLRNAFHKLGVKRRTQLAVLVAAKDPQALSSAAPR